MHDKIYFIDPIFHQKTALLPPINFYQCVYVVRRHRNTLIFIIGVFCWKPSCDTYNIGLFTPHK